MYFLCLQASSLSYFFAGIPILNALRFIITINSIINNEEMAPTKKIALNAISFGTVWVKHHHHHHKLLPSKASKK
jgi:hypothetical protein